MAQDTQKILPLYINTDKSFDSLQPDESPMMKGLTWDINANPGSTAGMANPSGEGQNLFALTPARSNEMVKMVSLPDGFNKSCGTFESRLTKELYHFNYNDRGNHGIYVIDGNTGTWKKVIIDPELGFTDDQEAVLSNRVLLRYVKGSNGEIVEKHLMWTNGKKWHGWVNVVAAMGSNGFDASLYPYWVLKPPHFDRRELLEWAIRPPMVKPSFTVVPNTQSDLGKQNTIADKNIRVAYVFINTDERFSVLSPYSLPIQIKTEEYANDINNLPRKVRLKMYAGSPLTEKIQIYVQEADDTKSLDGNSNYGQWKLYDTITKFNTSADGRYWERTDPWSSYNYDPVLNTIEYDFDNSRVGLPLTQDYVTRIQTGMPQLSVAATDLEDAALLCNNRYGYNNLSKNILDKLSAVVKEKTEQVCSRPLRTIYLYAYIGMCDYNFTYVSQVGYRFGDEDDTIRFGGMRTDNNGNIVTVDVNESKMFGLDFADKSALRVYLRGTPYYADGEWCIVKTDNSIEPVGKTYDLSNADDRMEIRNIFRAGSYFICRFKLVVPAGRYIATIGRHNVSNDGDWRGTSTYIYGIANSRVKFNNNPGSLVTLKPGSIVSTPYTYSKDMEIDCTAGNVDVWGNGADTFYVYCPYFKSDGGQGRYAFIEGYFKETRGNGLPVEMFPYFSDRNNLDDWGRFTDKNGFYWGYTKAADSEVTNIQFRAVINCNNATFNVATAQQGSGWKKNADAYLETQNSGEVGNCNRVILRGSVRDLTGSIGYSNIAITMRDGPTVYTDSNGDFEMYVHNGFNTTRTSTVYANGGNGYTITLFDCGYLPTFPYDQAQCNNPGGCPQPIIYRNRFDLQVLIQNNSQTSLKEGGRFSVGAVVADLAGRMSFVNVVQELEVSSFLQRDNTAATYIQMLIDSTINFAAENTDFKWFAPYVSKNTAVKRYLQWVGDKIIFLDNSGNVVTDPSAAVFAKIVIDSLYDANISRNFTLLSNYQFVKGDRVTILDNGDGELFDTNTYGSPIDLQIYGTNYNQAAINAGLLVPNQNTIITNSESDVEVGIIVKYDQRLNRVNEKTGFWVDIYTPALQTDVIPFFEIGGFYPIINGQIAEFVGYNNGIPSYNYLTSIDIDYWDAYYVNRAIAGKYFDHPFVSPNVTDTWGSNITSGGRIQAENKEAKQEWFGGDVIRSDRFLAYNGLCAFRSENRKNYGIYPFGEILVAHTKRNIVAFNCVNDWFVAEFNMPYTRVESGTLVVTNLDENLSLPKQKGGPMYGFEIQDMEAFVVDEDFFFWYDRKNTAIVKCNYAEAIDISQQLGDERGGIQSYLNSKTYNISNWNNTSENPYGIRYSVEPYGAGQLLFTFSWNSIPPGALSSAIQYSDNNGTTWNSQTGGISSPRTIVLNNAQWKFRVVFHLPNNQNYAYDFGVSANKRRFDVVAGIDAERGNIYWTFRPRRNNSTNPLSFVSNKRGYDLNSQETFVYSVQYKAWLPCANFTPEAYARLRGNWANVEMITFANGVPYLHNNTSNESFLNYYGVQTEPSFEIAVNKEKDIVKIFGSLRQSINGSGFFADMVYENQPNSFSYIPDNYWQEREKMRYAPFLRDMSSYPPTNPEELFRSMLFDGKRMFGPYLITRLVQRFADLGNYFQLTGIEVLFTASHNTKP